MARAVYKVIGENTVQIPIPNDLSLFLSTHRCKTIYLFIIKVVTVKVHFTTQKSTLQVFVYYGSIYQPHSLPF